MVFSSDTASVAFTTLTFPDAYHAEKIMDKLRGYGESGFVLSSSSLKIIPSFPRKITFPQVLLKDNFIILSFFFQLRNFLKTTLKSSSF